MNIMELIVETSVFKKDRSNRNNIYTSPRSSDVVSEVKYDEKARDSNDVDNGDDDDDVLNTILDLSDSSISRYARSGIDSAVQIIVYVASRDYVYQIAPYFKTLNTVIALKANGDI